MRKVIPVFVGAMLCASSLHVHAETIMEIFDLAVANDPKLLAAQAKREAHREHKKQAFSEFLPKLGVTGSYGQNRHELKRQVSTIVTDFAIDTTNYVGDQGLTNDFPSMQAYLTLRQPVFDMGIFARNKMAEIEHTRADLGYRIAQQDLLFRVIEHYFKVLRKTGDLNFARAEKSAISKQLRQTRARFDAGLIAVTDVHEAQARHDLSAAQEVVAENELALAEEQLREITGKNPRRLFPLKENTPLVPPTPSNINDWVEAARVQNLRIAETQLSADVARQKVKEVGAKSYPTVDVRGNLGYIDNGGLYAQTYTDANISLNVGMSLYEGGSVQSQKRQAIKELEAAQHLVEQIEREVLTQTRSAYLGVLAGMSYVRAISQAVSSSEKALRATEAGFDVNTRTAIDVLDAQRELFRNQRDYAHARYDYILNTLRLKIAIGLLTVDDLAQINDWLQ